MESKTTPENPYMGPVSFDESRSNLYFGRSDEIRELTSLVIARRAVLLYSQSGAGKTSLINAGLIPELRRREEIAFLPIARVSGAGEAGESNPYVANALTYLLKGGKTHDQTLQNGLRTLLADDTSDTPHLLIFDQFEEIFTNHPELTGPRSEFFQQLKGCLEEFPQLTLLIAMREDYLANLDSYAGYLPDRMRTRMRLERLKFPSAVAGVRGPAAQGGKPFVKGVAEQLVKNLCGLGEYVEPVQLQIVCFQLWSNLPATAVSITADDVEKHANVDDALTRFYTGALEAARKASGVSERSLRQWFSQHLITPARKRGLVYKGKQETAGLPNAAVDSLEKSYLVRDARGGGEYYELTHDRLVEPILDSNQKWRAGYRNPVADAYERWVSGGRTSDKLLNGNQLAEARKFALENPLELSPEETAFLKTSVDEAKRVRRNKLIVAGVAAAVLLSLTGLWRRAEGLQKEAQDSAEKAVTSEQKALEKAVEAKWQSWYATGERFFADQQKALAQQQAVLADEQAKAAEHERMLATARDLAGGSDRSLFEDPERGLILALHSLAKASMPVTLTALHAALLTPGRITVELGRRPVALALTDKQVAAFNSNGALTVWDLGTQKSVVPSFDPAPTVNFETVQYRSTSTLSAVSLDSAHVAAITKAGLLYLWETAGDWTKPRRRIQQLALPPGDTVVAIALSPSGDLLAAGTQGSKALVWKTQDFSPVADATITFNPNRNGNQYCSSVSFSPDGKTFIAVSADRIVARFDLEKRRLDKPGWGIPIYVERIAIFPPGDPTVPIFGSGWGTITAPVDDVKAHNGRITAMALNRDGTRLATVGEDGNAYLWDARKGAKLRVLTRHQGPLTALAYSGSRLATGSARGRITVIDLGYERDSEVGSFRRAHDDVSSLAFAPDGGTLASGGADGRIKLWNLAGAVDAPAGRPMRQIATVPPLRVSYNPRVTGLTFNARGDRLASSSWNQYVRVLDVAKVRSQCEAGAPCAPDAQKFGPLATMGGVSFGSDGNLVAFSAKGVWLWPAVQGSGGMLGPKPVRLMPDKEATAIFTREASAFAAAAFSGAVEIWTLKDLVNPAYRFAETSPVVLDVSRAGGRVAISTPNSVKVIDIDLHSRTHREKFRVTDIANYASFSPDGSVLAVSASDETIKLWNVDTGELLLTLAGHEHEATQLAFSRDGKRLASGGKDGAVQVYALTVPELLRIARSRIHRDLTTEECEEYLHSKTCPTMESVFRTISSRGERR